MIFTRNFKRNFIALVAFGLVVSAGPLLAGGFSGGGALSGSGAVYDPIVPADGIQNITGNFGVSGTSTFDGDVLLNDGLEVTTDALFSSSGHFTGDLTLNGGTGALRFGTGETIIPADGTMNVTGQIAVSSTIQGDNFQLATASAMARFTGTGGVGIDLFSARADGASNVGVYIRTSADYTTAGAKIVSFGDNAGTSYAEKAYVGLGGEIYSSATGTKGSVTLNADGTTASTVTVLSGAKCVVGDESGNGVIGNPGFSVTTTTLTIVNNAVNKGHVIDYHCF